MLCSCFDEHNLNNISFVAYSIAVISILFRCEKNLIESIPNISLSNKLRKVIFLPQTHLLQL